MGRYYCLTCGGCGHVRDPEAFWFAFWARINCPDCGGSGDAKPPTGPRPVSPPPPPAHRVVTMTRPAVEKGNQNPDNTSDARPAPPGGSGEKLDPSIAASVKAQRVLARLFDDLKHPERFRLPPGTFAETIIVDAEGVRRDLENLPWWADQGPLPTFSVPVTTAPAERDTDVLSTEGAPLDPDSPHFFSEVVNVPRQQAELRFAQLCQMLGVEGRIERPHPRALCNELLLIFTAHCSECGQGPLFVQPFTVEAIAFSAIDEVLDMDAAALGRAIVKAEAHAAVRHREQRPTCPGVPRIRQSCKPAA